MACREKARESAGIKHWLPVGGVLPQPGLRLVRGFRLLSLDEADQSCDRGNELGCCSK